MSVGAEAGHGGHGLQTYITGVEDSGILPANLGKHVAFVKQESMHVSDETEIFLVPRCLANGLAPFFNSLQDLCLNPAGTDRRALWEAADEFVEKFLCADLQVKRIAAILDADVEEIQGQKRDIGISVVDELDNGDCGLSRGIAFFRVDQVHNLEVDGEIRLQVGHGVTGIVYEPLQV